ncbi:MAG: 50S ribosomal protein L3 [Candidatus Doudnabacteria bacterium]|nr:50S ribosomal protein L3 [Candidatus Doudnabacteria bacterium]
MSKFIIAEKLHMSQIFTKDGKVIPVTILKAAPNKITQVRTTDKDKYQAVQVGFGRRKKATKSLAGHTKELGNFAKLIEFRVEDASKFSRGQEIKVDMFAVGDMVKVTGEMKGRGFAGPIKRHGFHGAPATHGHDHPRAVGAIGGRFPQHVRKGLRMAGHMAGVRTVKNLEVIEIDAKRNLIAVKGAVPGAPGGIVKVQLVIK